MTSFLAVPVSLARRAVSRLGSVAPALAVLACILAYVSCSVSDVGPRDRCRAGSTRASERRRMAGMSTQDQSQSKSQSQSEGGAQGQGPAASSTSDESADSSADCDVDAPSESTSEQAVDGVDAGAGVPSSGGGPSPNVDGCENPKTCTAPPALPGGGSGSSSGGGGS
jgi:hypothetical protein